ncbi:MAG: mercury methylation corrinoid protein HgcA [Syntrophomonadaceae bacterium]|jgi:hypothetical protein|nr:mercury methylation corrinoid protein HgcA [Syntrophomonadaceae bacterium]
MAERARESCCTHAGGPPAATRIDLQPLTAPAEVPQVATTWTAADYLGAWKARWGINRMRYAVEPGLYRVGTPGPQSPVLVSANYRLSFNLLRRALAGIDAWLLVLDTRGINVWCAAGKGTFGTAELARMVFASGLHQLVSHRTLVVPQLGAPGVAAHQVRALTGFRVVYGPVRAADLPAFLAAGMKATPAMRQVRFDFWDRVVLTPIELVGTFKYLLAAAALLLALNASRLAQVAAVDTIPYLGALLAGTVVTPAMLPWIPGRAFAAKGWLVGTLWAGAVATAGPALGWPQGFWARAAMCLLTPAITSFLAMNFTGASPYTSLSGVQREMKAALPAIAAAAGLGLVAGLIAWVG